MNTIAKYTRLALSVTLACSLFACGGADENQDGPSLNTGEVPTIDNSTTIAGIAMDGYVANGLVWIDIKDNDTLDGTEPTAYTDSQGYFSYNPISGVNYCEATEAHLQQYCLKTGLSEGSVEVKITKGIKVTTGVPFRNVMSTQVDLQLAASNFTNLIELGAKPSGDTQVWQQQVDRSMVALSPLGTLDTYLSDDLSLRDALSVFGFEFSEDISNSELLQMDYVKGLRLNTTNSAKLLSANVMISSLVNSLTGTYDLAFDSIDLGFDGYPISTADSVYKGLAESLLISVNEQAGNQPIRNTQMRSASLSSNTAVAQNQQLIADFRAAVNQQVRNDNALLGEATNFSQIINTNLESIQSNEQLTTIIEGRFALNSVNEASQINDLLESTQLLSFTMSPADLIDSLGTLPPSGSNALVLSHLQTVNALNNALAGTSAVSDFTRVFNPSTSASLDLKALADAVLENTIESIGDIPSGSEFALASVENEESILSGRYLSLSGVQDGGEQGQVVAFFNGSNDDSSGSLIMCIAYNNDNDPSDNINGQRFDGSWNTIGDSQNRISLLAEGFSVQMNIAGETRGSDIPSEQQVPSLQRNPNEFYGKYRFTLNESSAVWHSDNASIDMNYGLQISESIPASDTDCQSFLAL